MLTVESEVRRPKLPEEGEQAFAAALPEELQPQQILEELPLAVYIATAGASERIVYMSGGVETMLGTSPQEWIRDGQLWLHLLHAEDAGRVLHEQAHARVTGKTFHAEYRMVTRSGRTVWVEHESRPLGSDEGAPLILGTIRDITAHRQVEDRLRGLAYVDELTGLLNRRGFMHSVEQQMGLARRTGRSAVLLYLDIDGLKVINDTFGHEAGDQVLEDVAGLLRTCMRSTDIIGRNGGDEFVAWAVETDGDRGDLIKNRLLQIVKDFNLQGIRPYSLSMSIGSKFFDPRSETTLQELLRYADREMYRRKTDQRSRRASE